MSDRSFVFVLGSSRIKGNSEILACRAADHLPAGTTQAWIDLKDHPLPDFEDHRHDPARPTYGQPEGVEKTLLDATLSATDLVIVSPLYWYSVSATVKRYLDFWTGWLKVPGLDFRQRMGGRTLWGVTAMADEEPELADPLIGTLRNTADYMGMNFGGVLLGYASAPGQVARDAAAWARAETFFAS